MPEQKENLKVIKYFKPDCAPCYTMERRLMQMQVPDWVIIVNKSVADTNNLDEAKKFGVTQVPALVKENGEILQGLHTIDEVKEFFMENKSL